MPIRAQKVLLSSLCKKGRLSWVVTITLEGLLASCSPDLTPWEILKQASGIHFSVECYFSPLQGSTEIVPINRVSFGLLPANIGPIA